MSKLQRAALAIVRSSFVWGGLAALGFFALLQAGTLSHAEFFNRYFAGHWVEYVETILFFVALAELVLRAFDVGEQLATVGKPLLGPPPATPRPVAEAQVLLDKLASLPAQRQAHYLPRRLAEALVRVLRKGSADSLDEELKYLADVDAARSHSGYALVRIIIWAIPILGFLGTVIGITVAIASLSPEALEESLPEVTAGLGVAFDTTALALGLSMVLMFVQFQVDRLEGRLLERVDQRAALELAGRFEQLGDGNPQLGLVRRMAETVLRTTERTVQQQAELWQATIDAAHARWMDLSSTSQQQLEVAIGSALERSLRAHAQELSAAEATQNELNREHWDRVGQSLHATAAALQSQQGELARQGELLLQIVDASNQVARLEETLNGNLAALAAAQHFEETMLNLSASLHLLNARLGQLTPAPAHVGLKDHPPAGRAA